ncbi:MAG: hypothetical protein IPQ00_03055 [Chloracidobacterium sp.]|nr:hypothetical protein [Chloracidobacterium sp.]
MTKTEVEAVIFLQPPVEENGGLAKNLMSGVEIRKKIVDELCIEEYGLNPNYKPSLSSLESDH